MAGLMSTLMIGLIGIVFKLIIVDLLANVFRPLILLFGNEPMVIPLTIVFIVALVFLVGIPASHIKLQEVMIRFLEKILPKVKHGAIVERSVGVYDLAVVIKQIKLQRLSGITQALYLLYYPSSPTAWTSGLPLGLASEDKLILFDSSDREIFTTIATFGIRAPDVIREIINKKELNSPRS